jgi:hypothetical protein
VARYLKDFKTSCMHGIELESPFICDNHITDLPNNLAYFQARWKLFCIGIETYENESRYYQYYTSVICMSKVKNYQGG